MPRANSIVRKVITALCAAYSSDAAFKHGLAIAALLLAMLLTIWIDSLIMGLALSRADR